LRGLGLGTHLRQRQGRRPGAAETGGGGRWELCSGEPAARAGQQASVEAFVEQEEDRSCTVGRCKRPEHRFTVTPWAATMAAWWRCVTRRRTATALFMGELKVVDRLTCTPRRREGQYKSRRGQWGGRDVRGRRPGYGDAATGRAARRGHAASAGRV
jgi:hypothetical protein